MVVLRCHAMLRRFTSTRLGLAVRGGGTSTLRRANRSLEAMTRRTTTSISSHWLSVEKRFTHRSGPQQPRIVFGHHRQKPRRGHTSCGVVLSGLTEWRYLSISDFSRCRCPTQVPRCMVPTHVLERGVSYRSTELAHLADSQLL